MSSNKHSDIVVFTVHKSASMFLHTLCQQLAKLAKMDYHSPNGGDHQISLRQMFTEADFWKGRRGCFAPIRVPVEIPEMEDKKILLHLRDPRDVLVSMYFSYCYIHPGAVAANTGYRKEVAEQGIDKFVVTKAREKEAALEGNYGTGAHVQDLAGSMLDRYEVYIDRFVGQPNVTLVSYEQMVTDFQGWLEKVLPLFPLRDHDKTMKDLLAREAEFFPKRSEDVMTHIRHIQPGDHKDKLQPETIAELNEVFGNVLSKLDYV